MKRKRSYGRRRRGGYRKRFRRSSFKRTRRSTARRFARQQLLFVRRYIARQTIFTGNSGTELYASKAFILSDTPNVSEFTTLFDQYKITGVAWRWVCQIDPMVATTKVYPKLYSVVDFDDVAAPTSFTDIVQYPNLKEFIPTDGRPVSRWHYFKPARAAVEYESAVNSAYRPQWKGFVDCASSTAPHFGLKFCAQEMQSGVVVAIEYKYYLAFKNIR